MKSVRKIILLISIDNSTNYAAHNLYYITPKIQNESLLTRVTTLQSDLY